MDRYRRKLDNSLCVECQWNKATIRNKPNGHLLPVGMGFCVDCRERKIRQFQDLSIIRKRLDDEGGNVRLFF